MKIAVRGGHNSQATGCSGLVNELTEDRKVKDSVIKYLQQLGHSVLDVTPGSMGESSDLYYGVNKANEWGAELFISVHFNKAYNSYDGELGSEVCVYSKFDIAQRVVDKLGSLGFKNRGQKVRTDLYELNNTSMSAMIIEVCFVEARRDVELYKILGSDTVGKAIAESIVNKNVEPIIEIEYLSYDGVLQVGSKITTYAKSTDDNIFYRFYYEHYGNWTTVTDWQEDNKFSFIPRKVGDYKVVCHVKYRNNNTDTEDAYNYMTINIKDKPSIYNMKVNGQYYGETYFEDIAKAVEKEMANGMKEITLVRR